MRLRRNRRDWLWRHIDGIILDAGLLLAALLAAFTSGTVLWFHMIFVMLTISSLFLEFRTIALRAVIWVPIASLIVAIAVRQGSTQSAELVELPLLTAILAVVLAVSHRRTQALHGLERAQALLADHHRAERDHLEQQLVQSQKMDALGRLAGGIAHDFNNVLTAILGHTEDLVDDLEGEPALVHAEGIDLSVRRAGALIDDLMSFSRQDDSRTPVVIAVNDVVEEVAGMLRRLLGEDIDLVIQLGADRCCVRTLRSRLERVVVNLAVNARDAMPAGGTLTLATCVVAVDGTEPDIAPGRYATLTVTDTGSGIRPEIAERVFEPFFTTRIGGRGAGLGLSTVSDIARLGGGAVQLVSEHGRGTTVKVLLPAVDGEAMRTLDVHDGGAAEPGSETVLLVEDDVEVRRRVRTLLERGGYEVLDAGSGAEALAVAAGHSGAIDLLVSDVVMPGMSGPELADAMRVRQPSIKVLLMSGYMEGATTDRASVDAEARVLRKPFRRGELLARVRSLLDDHPPAADRSVLGMVPAEAIGGG